MAALDRNTRTALAFSVAVAVLMIAQQLAGKALRDAFFLSHFEASSLPTIMLTASFLSVLAVLGTAQLFRRIAPARLVPLVFFASAAWFVGEWALSAAAPRIAAASLYVHTTSFGAVVVSGFWSVINERFDPHTAKRVIGRIAGGATAGGVLGGLAAWQGAARVSIGGMILVLAVVNLTCGIGLMRLGASTATPTATPGASKPEDEPSALAIMEETPYLWQLALLVAVSALGAAAFDYVFKARAAAAFDSSEALVSFFALFYLGLGVVTFAFQNLFATRALKWLGLSATVATMPGTVVILGFGTVIFGGLWSALLLRGGAAVIESSLYRSGYELLYTPLTPEKKRPTKTLIDVGADKLGAAAGSGLALVVIGLFPSTSETILLWVAIACGVGALLVTRVLHRGYVASLADNLRSGAIDASAIVVTDRTTRATVDQTMASFDREHVLAALRAEAERGAPTTGDRPAAPRSASKVARASAIANLDAPLSAEDTDETLRAIAALRSGAPDRVQAVLRHFQPLPGELVAHAIAGLAGEAVRDDLCAALQRVAPAHTGVIADALLSARTPYEVRRAIPAVLEAVATQRSADALVRALAAESFELRFRVAAALRRIVSRNRALELDAPKVYAAVERAAFEGRLVHPAAADSDGRPASRTLAYAFVLLSSVLPPEPLRLALEALATDDAGRRGTGLEYLENVLPKGVKAGLQPLLRSREAAIHANRPEQEVLQEVADAHAAGWVDLEGLIARMAGAAAG